MIALLPSDMLLSRRLLIGWDAGIALYLMLVYTLMGRAQIEEIRAHASDQDEGRFAMLVLTVTAPPVSLVGRLGRSGLLRFFGKYSYGLYVFHYPIGGLLTSPVRVYIDGHFHKKVLGVVAGAIVVFIASTLVALLSYHFYELPFLKLKKYFAYRKNAAAATDRRAALRTT